jgi:endonuclease/exonuclease/phosphatase family metal-dependent hydrolase
MSSIKIQTFNAGLLKVFAKDIVPYVDERLDFILDEILKVDADIICFQEVFEKKHVENFKKTLTSFKYFSIAKANNFFKAPGLLVFSKFPILEKKFNRFEAQQDIENFSNHGYEKLRIQIENNTITLFNVHLTAGGLTGNLETKRAAKVANKQFTQLYKDIEYKENTILVGDFNCGPRTDNETYEFILEHGFNDVLINQNLDDFLTWDNQNTLVARQNFEMPSDRIDHLFIHETSKMKLVDAKKNLNKVYHREPFNLSDHYGLNFNLEI